MTENRNGRTGSGEAQWSLTLANLTMLYVESRSRSLGLELSFEETAKWAEACLCSVREDFERLNKLNDGKVKWFSFKRGSLDDFKLEGPCPTSKQGLEELCEEWLEDFIAVYDAVAGAFRNNDLGEDVVNDWVSNRLGWSKYTHLPITIRRTSKSLDPTGFTK